MGVECVDGLRMDDIFMHARIGCCALDHHHQAPGKRATASYYQNWKPGIAQPGSLGKFNHIRKELTRTPRHQYAKSWAQQHSIEETLDLSRARVIGVRHDSVRSLNSLRTHVTDSSNERSIHAPAHTDQQLRRPPPPPLNHTQQAGEEERTPTPPPSNHAARQPRKMGAA